MSVPKGKRGISEMEFYATAVRLRTDINAWLLRDFGIKEKVRNLTITGKKYRMSDEDIKALSELLDRYGLGESILDSYPDWWIEQRRKTIDKRLADLMDCIVSANSIYAVSRQEYWERRPWQCQKIQDASLRSADGCFIQPPFCRELRRRKCL